MGKDGGYDVLCNGGFYGINAIELGQNVLNRSKTLADICKIEMRGLALGQMAKKREEKQAMCFSYSCADASKPRFETALD